jgi:hypothetical protein
MAQTIITNCTSRKRNIGIDPVLPYIGVDVSIEESISIWLKRVKASSIRVSPLNLYQGRSITDSRYASRLIGAQWYAISTGLGLVSEFDQIPAYSLTIADGTGSIQKWLTAQNRNSGDWWTGICEALGSPSPISTMVNRCGNDDRIMLALPARYVAMIASDLLLIEEDRHENVRVFTSIAGAKEVPAKHRQIVMPYDERLEGIKKHNGTRSDFPQRALKHFVTDLNAQSYSLKKAKLLVQTAMESAQARTSPTRIKATNEQIANLIIKNWKDYGGSSSKLLRFLRDEAKVSCEQSRFSGIWREILMKKSA